MNCQDVHKFVYTYLDCEFEEREKAEFEAHISMCDPCHSVVERDASFRDAVRRHLSGAPVDEALKLRLQQRLSQAHQSVSFSRRMGVPLALAASITLALLSWRAMQSSGEANVTLPPTAPIATAAVVPTGADRDGSSDPKLAELRAKAIAAVVPAPATKAPEKKAIPSQPDRLLAVDDLKPRPKMRGGEVKLVSNSSGSSVEVLDGSVGADFLVQHSRFGAVRSVANLRAIVRAHARPLPPEVHGTARQVQRFLSERLPFMGAPPIAEGVGVRLYGARLTQLAGRPVVQYYYDAFGKQLTAFRFVSQPGAEPFDDPEVVQTSPGERGAQANGMVVDRLAGYSVLHAMRGDDLVCVISELDANEVRNLLEGPTVL